MTDYDRIQLRNGVEVAIGDHLLVMNTLHPTDAAKKFQSGDRLVVDEIKFDDEGFESGHTIISTANSGWIFAHKLSTMINENRIVVGKRDGAD